MRWTLTTEKMNVAIQKFRVCLSITVTMSALLLPLTDFRAHTFEKPYLKSHLNWLKGPTVRGSYIDEVFFMTTLYL